MSIVSGSPPSAPASMGGLSSAVEDVSTGMSSLRFDGSSYLSRTFGSGDQKTWTWSGWCKRTLLTGEQVLMSNDTAANDTNRLQFRFSSGVNLLLAGQSTAYRRTNAVYRDTSAWLHTVVHYQSGVSDPVKIYVNGETLSSFSSTSDPSGDLIWNSNTLHKIGSDLGGVGSGSHFHGYLANIHFIDGYALPPEATGELISDVWRPKKYSGDYGVNGFHLDFHPDNMVYDVNGQLTTVMDASGNDNHWTAH